MALWKVSFGGSERLARGSIGEGPKEYLPVGITIDSILAGGEGALSEALSMATNEPVEQNARVVAPIGGQDVWAAGVTYLRSRTARMEEAAAPDHYSRVYSAERPEIFWKSNGWRVRGPDEPIGVRADSTWDVPEPELGLVINSSATIAGYVIVNDVSSRSIEADNPLYLPQAKCFVGGCSLGPCIVPVEDAPPTDDMRIVLQITRGNAIAYEEAFAVGDMKRLPEDLVMWLFRAMEFPVGVFLATGTGVVPPASFSLKPDDDVVISIDGLGQLANRVERVGTTLISRIT